MRTLAQPLVTLALALAALTLSACGPTTLQIVNNSSETIEARLYERGALSRSGPIALDALRLRKGEAADMGTFDTNARLYLQVARPDMWNDTPGLTTTGGAVALPSGEVVAIITNAGAFTWSGLEVQLERPDGTQLNTNTTRAR